MTKITVNMGNNLRKSYSKYESHARMFATARPDLVVAGLRQKKKTRSPGALMLCLTRWQTMTT